MFGHFPELIIIMVIALIVFGPEKLPEMAANAGKMVREVRSAMDTALNPEDFEIDDFSTYYEESVARSGEDAAVDEVDYEADYPDELEGPYWQDDELPEAEDLDLAAAENEAPIEAEEPEVVVKHDDTVTPQA